MSWMLVKTLGIVFTVVGTVVTAIGETKIQEEEIKAAVAEELNKNKTIKK